MKISEKILSYTIEIFDDPAFSINSTDNKIKYDMVVECENEATSKHGIIIRDQDKIVKSLIILSSAGGTGIHKNAYIIEENDILLCVGDCVYKISIPELDIAWKTKVDDSTAFEIYRYKSDFIIHGELSITKINNDGKISWQEYGSDIFVTESGKDNFEIRDDLIYAKSWDGRKYCFDSDGKDHLRSGNSS